jgi:hypothetical protein
MRREGVPLAFRQLGTEAGVVGELLVFEQRDEALRRTVRVASLRAGTAADLRDLLPPLIDACLLWMSTGGFALAGFERVPRPRTEVAVDYAQTWWCRQEPG